MNQKWNLQDIQPASPRKRRTPVDPTPISRPTSVTSKNEADEVMSIDIRDGKKGRGKSFLLAFVIFFVIVGVGLGASALMGGAEVTVYPKFKEPNVNALFSANLTPKPEELTYEIMTLEAEGERQVQASGQEEVESQAEGTILIYNKQQKDPIRLVTNTRFESPNGLIYKIKDAAVVPGYKVGPDGEIIPGVLPAEVYAEEVGEKYNIAPSKFTIPGFKGDPEYENIYGESVDTMHGGFKGQKFIIDDNELKTAQQALRLELRNSLLDRVNAERPAGLTSFDGAVTFTYVSLPSVEFGDNLATIKEKALMRIPLFKEEDFAKFIAASTIPGYERGDVRIEDPSTLTFSYENATTSSSDISLLTTLDFNLQGKPRIIWEYDAGRLKTDLLNVDKTALPSVLGNYPAIERAEAVIRPFWKTKFPTNLNEIQIIEVVESSN